MIPPKIAPLPPAPVRADAPVDFSSKADAMVGALQPFADQANILADFVNDRADDANASATSVEGVQSAVSADRVLSQQAASNAAGSAAAALNSANTANSRATAAQQAANASEASAVRAEDAAQYVEGMTDGAAPINNPNFTGEVKVNDVPLGTAATRNVGESAGNVMEVGAFGLGSAAGYPMLSADDLTLTTQIAFLAAGDVFNPTLNALRALNMRSGSISTGVLIEGTPEGSMWFYSIQPRIDVRTVREVCHTGNIQSTTGQSTEYPMTQKAVTDAINAAVANIDVSGPRPTKDHGDVATAGSQTVVCNVQESDFHIMSMGTANTTGTLTIDFANMPDTVGKHFSWHVRLQRGGRKNVEFAQTINWAGGVAPTFGSIINDYDLMMFYKVDNETIRGMVIDAW